MAKAYVLSEADVALLRELADRERRRPASTLTGRLPEPDPTAPETYIARTPAGGIESLQEAVGTSTRDAPGWASCDVYRIVGDGDDARLHQVGALAKIVYNLSHERVGGRRWVAVARDKFGRWLVAAPPSPDADVTDTGTGTDITPADPPYDDTGTGTGAATGGPGGYYYPCAPVAVVETDLFCEPGAATVLHTYGDLGTGTGTGTDVPPAVAAQYYLNLYKRFVLLGVNAATGCIERQALAWQFVRTVACCEPECAAPDTGTGDPTAAPNCCTHGSLYASVGYTLSGPTLAFCAACTVSGTLHQSGDADGLRWTNSSGGSTCGGRALLALTLYCSGTQWRASGKLRRYEPGSYDATQEFDVALSFFSASTLIGTISAESGCSGSLTLQITSPCYSYDCDNAGNCNEVAGEAGEYATVEDCEANCVAVPDAPGDACCAGGVPTILYGTVTAKTGGWTTLPDSITLVHNGLSSWIVQEASWTGSLTCTELTCLAGNPYFSSAAEAGWACEPYQAVFLLDQVDCAGLGVGSCTLTITE